MKQVTLLSAYFWHCEECASENYDRGVNAEFGPGEREEAYRKFHNLEDFQELPEQWEQFEMVTVPGIVQCKVCGQKFETQRESVE